jgi:hypothetical protein
VISSTGSLETNVAIIFFQNFSIVINFLFDGEMPHPERHVARPAPATITWDRVSVPCIEVCTESIAVYAEYPSISLN